MMETKATGWKYVLDTIENEGFEYAFLHYSDFPEVKDPEFHRLRNAYIAAQKELAKYLGVR